jgi:hypothetical protein
MKSQYIIILSVIITLTAGMLFLSQMEKTQREDSQNFWSIYFISPLTNSDNRFVIDNKTDADTTFHYEITVDNEMKDFGDIEIKKDERKLIETKDFDNQNLTIIVTNGQDKQKIEKK